MNEIQTNDIRNDVKVSTDSSLTSDYSSFPEVRNYEREGQEQLLEFREEYARKFWKLTKASLFFVGIYLLLSTLHLPVLDRSVKLFNPSDTILIALLTTTTANIISILIVFARFLFPDGGVKNDQYR